MKKYRLCLPAVAAALLATVISGCGMPGINMTKIESNHPLLEQGAGQSSTVYFIRPNTERAMGFPDNPLSIELDQERLLSLGKGEYTMVRLKPRPAVTMTLRSKTAIGPNWTIKELSKDKKWAFASGETYYIVLKPVDGEFRGVYFVAENVDPFTAREAAKPLHAVGAARSAPL